MHIHRGLACLLNRMPTPSPGCSPGCPLQWTLMCFHWSGKPGGLPFEEVIFCPRACIVSFTIEAVLHVRVWRNSPQIQSSGGSENGSGGLTSRGCSSRVEVCLGSPCAT